MVLGGGDNDIKIKVTLDSDNAEKNAKKLGDSIEQVEKKTTGLGGELSALSSTINKFSGPALAAGAAIAGIGAAAVGITKSLLDTAASVEGLQAQFNKLNVEAGANPVEQIEKLSNATKGLLTDAEIFEQFNKAATLGLPVERFEELSAAAVKVGRSIGVDATTAIESFTVGVGRQSIQMLDNLGIIIKSEEAYQKYADANDLVASKLTDTQKKAAFTAEAIEQLVNKSNEAADIQNTAALAYEQFGIAIENARKDAALAINENEDLRDSIKNLSTALKNVDWASVAKQAANVSAVIIDLAASFVKGAEAIRKFLGQTVGFNNFAENFSVGFTALTKGTLAAQVEVIGNNMQRAQEQAAKTNQELLDMASFVGRVNEEDKEREKNIESILDNNKLTTDELQKQIEHNEKLLISAQESLGIATENEAVASKIVEQIQEQALSAEDLVSLVKETVSEEDKQLDVIQKIGAQLDENAKIAEKQRKETEEATRKFADYANGISSFFKELGSIKDAGGIGGLLGDALTGSGGAGSFLGSLGIGDAKGEGGLGGALGISAGAASMYALFIQAFANGIDNLSKKKKEIDLNPQLFEDYANELQIAFEEGAGETFGGGLNERKFNEIWRRIFKDFDPLGQALGINDNLADIFGGPISGLQSMFGVFGSNDPGERARKAIIDALNELNDGLRLVIDGTFQDFNFARPGENAFGRPTTVTSADGDIFNTTEGFAELFSLSEEARAIFLDVGATLGTSMFEGLEEFAGSGIIGQIGGMLAEATGGSLNNLQLAFESMGISAEQLGAALDEAFFTGEISAKEYLSSINSVNELMSKGIPGAVGATIEAFDNLREGGLQSGQIAKDALGDIAAEFQEIAEAQGYNSESLNDLATQLIAAGADVSEVTKLMGILEQQGIDTVSELLELSNFETAQIVSQLEDANFAFDKPIEQIDKMNEKLDELENRRIQTYVDVEFRATGDPTARQAVEQGTGVDFGGQGY